MIEIAYVEKSAGLSIPLDRKDIDFNNKEDLKKLFGAVKDTLKLVAEDTLREQLEKGFDRSHLTLVDGKQTKNIDSVKPFGKIQYLARSDFKQVALDTYRKILRLSRVKSGGYLSMNFVYLNKTRIATSIRELENFFNTDFKFLNTDVIRFVNFAPYASKLERYGYSKNKGGLYKDIKWKKSTDDKQRSGQFVRRPNGTYALTAKSMKAKYGKRTRVKFELLPGNYIDPSVPLMKWHTQDKWRNTYDPKGKYNSGYYLYPTITISLFGSGITGVVQ